MARRRSPHREQPHAARLCRVLFGHDHSRLPQPWSGWRDLFDPRSRRIRASLARVCRVRVDRRAAHDPVLSDGDRGARVAVRADGHRGVQCCMVCVGSRDGCSHHGAPGCDGVSRQPGRARCGRRRVAARGAGPGPHDRQHTTRHRGVRSTRGAAVAAHAVCHSGRGPWPRDRRGPSTATAIEFPRCSDGQRPRLVPVLLADLWDGGPTRAISWRHRVHSRLDLGCRGRVIRRSAIWSSHFCAGTRRRVNGPGSEDGAADETRQHLGDGAAGWLHTRRRDLPHVVGRTTWAAGPIPHSRVAVDGRAAGDRVGARDTHVSSGLARAPRRVVADQRVGGVLRPRGLCFQRSRRSGRLARVVVAGRQHASRLAEFFLAD